MKVAGSLKQGIKTLLTEYPRIYRVCEWVFHFANFRSIAQNKIKAQERELRLYKYFEVVYDYELEYLRQHCRELEQGKGESLNIVRIRPNFPKVEFGCSVSDIQPHPGSEKSYIGSLPFRVESVAS